MKYVFDINVLIILQLLMFCCFTLQLKGQQQVFWIILY